MKYSLLNGLLWLLAAAVVLPEQAYAQAVLPEDRVKAPEGLETGTLDNGLSYVLMHNPSPSKMVECRLMFRSGSVLESDGNRGAAHFLEHMAFGGTRHFPDRKLVEYIESTGVQYGMGLNAYTGYDRTVYMFSVPTDTPRSLDNALLIVSDWLTGISLNAKDVEEEKGIILAELGDYDIGDDFYGLKMGCGKYSEGIPLGTADDIRNMTPEILADFHDRWYTLSRATLVMVGDIDTGEVRKKLEKKLGRLEPSVSPDCGEFPMEYPEGTSYAQVGDTLRRGVELELYIPHGSVHKRTMADALESARRSMLVRAIDRRFDDTDVAASVHNDWYLADTEHFLVSAGGDDWKDASGTLYSALAGLKRIAEQGFCDEELAVIKDRYVAGMHRPVWDGNSSDICASVEDMVLFGDTEVTDSAQFAWLKTSLAETTSEDLQNILSSWLSDGAGCRLVSYRFNPLTSEGASAAMADSVWTAAADAACVPYTFVPEPAEPEPDRTEIPEWLMEKLPFDRSLISAWKHYPSSGIDEIVLTNGFRFVLRPTEDPEDRMQMHIFAPGGLSVIPEEDFPLYEGMAGYMELGGIEGLEDWEYGSILAENGIGVLVATGTYWHEVIASGPSGNMRLMLNLARRKMTDPKLNYGDFEELRAEEIENFGEETYLSRLMKSDWNRQLAMKTDSLMGRLIYGRRQATVEDLERMSLDSMAVMHRKLFSNPDGMICVVCGSFDTDSLLAEAVPVFGTMESSGPNRMGESHFSLPEGPVSITFPEISEGQVSFDYLQYGKYPPSLRNTLILKLMRDVVRDRLITVLRERESLVYSPYISLSCRALPDSLYHFDINASVDSSNTARVYSILDGILEDLQKNRISAKELRTKKRIFNVNKRTWLEEDATANWKGYLVDELKNGDSMADFENYEKILDSITPEDLREGFRKYIDRSDFVILSLGDFDYEGRPEESVTHVSASGAEPAEPVRNPAAYNIFRGDGTMSSYADLTDSLKKAEIILIGETHNCPVAHWLELRITADLWKSSPEGFVQAAEMFETDNQREVDDYVSGKTGSDELAESARVWDNFWTDYEPLLFFAREHGLKFVASNVPRRYAAFVRENGLEALDTLSDTAKSYMAPLPIRFESSEETDAMFDMMRMISGVHSDGPSYYAEAQALKDATMAWSIARAFSGTCPDGNPVKKLVHYNGNYHSDNRGGIIPYLEEYLPGRRIATVCCIRQDDISALDEENAGRADFIIAVPVDMTMTY